jgi:hypothetical protein
VNTYKVDLDYESYLFDANYKADSPHFVKLIKEFEYVFFLINKEKCILKNLKNYSQEYLIKLKKLGFEIPQFDPLNENYINWWGTRKNLILEKKLNSKLTSALFSKEKKLGFFDGEIVNNVDEILNFIKNKEFKRWILKSPNGFSGIGHQIFNFDFIPLVQFNGPMLLEPLYDRICDLGITFEMQDKTLKRMFIVENFNNEKGSFKGGTGAKDLKTFYNYIQKKYNFDLAIYEKAYIEIFEYYKSLGAESNIQIDSFIYKEINSEELKLYPLVEVNYRKTMGLVIQSLAEHFNSPLIEWRITHTDMYESNKDWIKLSESGKFNSYVNCQI